MKSNVRIGRATLVVALACGLSALATQPVAAVDIEFKLDKQLDAFWLRMPQSGRSGTVTRLNNTDDICAGLALRQAKFALNKAQIRRGAWEAIKLTVDLSPVGGKALDATSVVVDFLDSEGPEDFIKKIGKTVSSKLGGKAAGKGAGYAGEKTVGKIYDQLTAKLKKGFSYSYKSSPCGLINITAWVRKRVDASGLEMVLDIAGDCQCKIKDRSGKYELGNWLVRGTLPIEAKVTKRGENATVTLGIKSGAAGRWSVQAQCPCKKFDEGGADSSGAAPSEPPKSSLPIFGDGFQPNDYACINKCFSLWQRYDRLRREAKESDEIAQKTETKAKGYADMAGKNRAKVKEAKRTLKNPPQGASNLGDILLKANNTIKAQPRLDEKAREEQRAADKRRATADRDRRWAQRALAELKDCLRKCIKLLCKAPNSKGFGDGSKYSATVKKWMRDIHQEILLPLVEEMRKKGQLKNCPKKKDEDASYGDGTEPISFGIPGLEFDSPGWCTYGGGTTSIPLYDDPIFFEPISFDPTSFDPDPTDPGADAPGGDSPDDDSARDTPSPKTPDSPGGDTPTSTTPGGDDVDEPRDVKPPDSPKPSEKQKEEDEEPKEDKTPKRMITLIIKAKKTVLADGIETAEGLPGALVKLDLGDPVALPIADNPKSDEGFDQDPIQGVTDQNGDLELSIPANLAAALATTDIEIDSTPQDSVIVHGALGAAINLPPVVLPWLVQQYAIKNVPLAVLRFPEDQLAAVKKALEGIPGIELVEPNSCRDKQGDPFFDSTGTWGQEYEDQWAIQRVGLTADTNSAWSLVDDATAEPVIVAVIDTGLDWNHQDFSWSNIWTNPDETENEIDDDGNGYVDDLIGWDFWDADNQPWDTDGHGTFVSGVIAAAMDNDIGIAGINPHAQIMVLKALNGFGHSRASYIAEAIVYAADQGARVINLSVGGEEPTRAEQMAIDYAHSKGALVVVAAGNNAIDIGGYAPAGFEHAFTVGATDFDDQRAPYSNWGAGIDVAAPGNDVLSLRARRTDLMLGIPGVEYEARTAYVGEDSRYYRASGTSFAAPIVSGVASLLLSQRPELTNDELARMLRQTAEDIETPGVDQFTGYGRLDATAALRADPAYFIEAAITEVTVVETDAGRGLQVGGSANADRFARAWIELGAGEAPSEWKTVSEAIDAAVQLDGLAIIPVEELRGHPVWIIRLIVVHVDGSQREARFRLALQ